jgi:two-component system response regulator AtoC
VIEIVAQSEGMREAVRLAERVAATDANVLVTGESGVGKDAIAFYIHSKSKRAGESFVKIDCGTLPSGEDKPGRLEASHRGTLVLDEIAHLSTDSQAKLLRVIETREFERLGGRRTIKVDARLIALTNVDLDDAVRRQNFREDLYYRLHVVQIEVPPLRQRQEDLPELAQSFVKVYANKHGRPVTDLSAEALTLLSDYQFPGNVRELANIIERAVIVASGVHLEVDDLPEPIRTAVNVRRLRTQPRTLAEIEAEYVAEVLAGVAGNKTEAARILGISRKNLYEKLARQKKDEDEG